MCECARLVSKKQILRIDLNIISLRGGGLNQTVDSDDDGLSTFISIIPLLITDMIITLIVWCVGRQHTEKSGIS